MLIDFFSIEPTYEVTVEYTNKKGETYTRTEQRANFLPTFERFAHSIDVNDDTIVAWANAKRSGGGKRYPEFSAAYTRAKQLQRNIIMQNALTNGYNSNFAIFLAKNIAGMSDKVQVPVDERGNPVPFVAGFHLITPSGATENDGKTDNNTDA